MSAPADDDVVVRGDAERGGDVDDRFRHLDVRTRRRGIAARMVVHQDDRSIACCTCLRQLRHFSDMARCQTFGPLCAAKRTLTKNEKSRPKAALQFNPDAGNLCLLTMHQLADDCGCAGWAHWIRLTFELF